ncbi:MAG: TonB-dependent receptor [Gammaproteobacteria bacterium]|nr:TonB-dependent receptor [Gammaproteobacteria bacterium]
MKARTVILALAGVVLALPGQAAVIEEIVVTAQKREQNVQDVGIAISALTGEQMRQLGYGSAQQVTAMAPGVQTVQPNGEANYAIAMRGVAANDFTTNVESPVAIYLDEVYISQMSGSGFMLFDMERVEMLRGPQGTLYGRNATGGLAHFVTVKPSQEASGYGQFTVGRYDQIKFEGAVGGPLSDTVSARLSLSTHNNDGYVKNRLLDKRLNNADDSAVRGQLLFEPTDSFSLLLNARRSKQDIDTGFFEHVSANVEGMFTPNEVNEVLGYIDNDGDVYEGDYDRDGHNKLETEGYTATINWDAEHFTLTSITDYSTVERDYIEDSDASPAPFFNFYLSTDAEQFSQEVRVNGSTDEMDWVAGVYYLDISVKDANGAETEPFITYVFEIPSPAVSGLDNPYETNTESWSIFGQIERRLGDRLTGIVGARWIRDEKDHEYAVNVVDFIPGTVQRNGNPNILAPFAYYYGERKDDEFAVRLAANYDLNDDVMLYASWNRGVKGGGYNSPVFPLSPPLDYNDATMSYDPEQLDAFEVGFKSRQMDGLMIFNGAFYYYDYKDYQAFQIVGIDTITTNANADSYGGELELQVTPAEGLDIILGAAYNDIEVDLGGGTPKTTSVQSPKWNLNGLIRYEWPLMSGSMAAQFDVLHRSKHYFSLTGAPTVEENGYTLMNASLMYTSAEGRWSLNAFVQNLGDEEHLVQTFDLSGPGVFGMVEQYYNRPRWWGISAAVYF